MSEMKIALSIEEAADYTGLGRNTQRKLVEWDKLPVLKVGRKVLIKKGILELFMTVNEGEGFEGQEQCQNRHKKDRGIRVRRTVAVNLKSTITLNKVSCPPETAEM